MLFAGRGRIDLGELQELAGRRLPFPVVNGIERLAVVEQRGRLGEAPQADEGFQERRSVPPRLQLTLAQRGDHLAPEPGRLPSEPHDRRLQRLAARRQPGREEVSYESGIDVPVGIKLCAGGGVAPRHRGGAVVAPERITEMALAPVELPPSLGDGPGQAGILDRLDGLGHRRRPVEQQSGRLVQRLRAAQLRILIGADRQLLTSLRGVGDLGQHLAGPPPFLQLLELLYEVEELEIARPLVAVDDQVGLGQHPQRIGGGGRSSGRGRFHRHVITFDRWSWRRAGSSGARCCRGLCTAPPR